MKRRRKSIHCTRSGDTIAHGWLFAEKAAVRGSFTVEAVFIFPMIVFLIAFMLQLSAGWFESIRQTAEDVEVLRELDTKTYFLREDALEGLLDALK